MTVDLLLQLFTSLLQLADLVILLRRFDLRLERCRSSGTMGTTVVVVVKVPIDSELVDTSGRAVLASRLTCCLLLPCCRSGKYEQVENMEFLANVRLRPNVHGCLGQWLKAAGINVS